MAASEWSPPSAPPVQPKAPAPSLPSSVASQRLQGRETLIESGVCLSWAPYRSTLAQAPMQPVRSGVRRRGECAWRP